MAAAEETTETTATETTETTETTEERSLIGGAAAEETPEAAETKEEATETPEEAPEEKPEAPEKYELQMPAGYELNEEALEAVSPILKKLGATNEDAQALADEYIKQLEARRNADMDAYADTIKGWKEATQNDPEIGGRNLAQNLSSVAKVIQKYGGAEAENIKAMLDDSGFGNHPGFVKMMVKVSKALDTDHWVEGSSGQKDEEAEQDAMIGRLFSKTLKK